jgi:GAF domain
MDVERVVRGVLARLDGVDEDLLDEVRDALREVLIQERRRSPAALTVETERERRLEAEALRAGLEGIVHQAHFADACEEVLRQLGRIVVLDSCSLALLEPGGELRIVAVEGFPDKPRLIGARYRDRLSDTIIDSHRAVAVGDAQSDERYAPLGDGSRVRAWAGVPLTVEGELIGILSLDRHTTSPFDDEEIHRAKALAFSAAAAIRNARLLESVERYATVMEHLVLLYRTATNGDATRVGTQLVEGAVRFGYLAGLWVREGRVAAVSGPAFEKSLGREAPGALVSGEAARLDGEQVSEIGKLLGVDLTDGVLQLVPLADDEPLGTLVLLDSGREGADATIEAYAARASAALGYAVRRR